MNSTIHNVYICGCVRNTAKTLFQVFRNIAQLKKIFREIHVVVAYDDSNDNTLEILKHIRERFPAPMDILVGAKEALTPVRTENIARARNALLEHIRQIHQGRSPSEASKWPYFIMMDMDEICGGVIRLDQLAAVLQPYAAAKWDAVSFNMPDYYDLWALSFDPYNYSCWHWEDPVPVCQKMKDRIEALLRETPEDEFLPCNSAFNGFAIYKIELFLGGHYLPQISPLMFNYSIEELRAEAAGDRIFHTEPDYRTVFDPDVILGDCEHRHFHFEAIAWRDARIRISPRRLFE